MGSLGRELPADPFFDLSLCFRREANDVLSDALRFRKHEFQRFFLSEEDFGMRHFLFREEAFQFGIPNPLCLGRRGDKHENQCHS